MEREPGMLVEVDNLRHEMQQTLDMTAWQLVAHGFEAQKRELNRAGRSPVNMVKHGCMWIRQLDTHEEAE
jgi:hypothetical protein